MLMLPKIHKHLLKISISSVCFIAESTNVLFHITVNIIVNHAQAVNRYIWHWQLHVWVAHVYTVKQVLLTHTDISNRAGYQQQK